MGSSIQLRGCIHTYYVSLPYRPSGECDSNPYQHKLIPLTISVWLPISRQPEHLGSPFFHNNHHTMAYGSPSSSAGADVSIVGLVFVLFFCRPQFFHFRALNLLWSRKNSISSRRLGGIFAPLMAFLTWIWSPSKTSTMWVYSTHDVLAAMFLHSSSRWYSYS